jgi:hypothetical protein
VEGTRQNMKAAGEHSVPQQGVHGIDRMVER